jgi:hypothetical protein
MSSPASGGTKADRAELSAYLERLPMGLLGNFLRKVPQCICVGVAYLSSSVLLVGLGTLAYQSLLYFKYGTWRTITVGDAVYKGLPDELTNWISSPTDWVGLAEVVSYLFNSPLWLVLVILWIPTFYLGFVIGNALDEFLQRFEMYHSNDESLKPIEEASGAELFRRIQGRDEDK